MTEAISLSAGAAIELIGDHLWQSTLVAFVVALLALVFRRNRAQVRHGLWLVASLKFLVPFAALMAIGRQFGWQTSDPIVTSDVMLVIDAVSQPFSQPSRLVVVPPALPASSTSMLPFMLLLIWGCGLVMMLLRWFREWRRVATFVRTASPVTEGREVQTLRRLERITGIATPIAMVAADESFEPAVFGILEPVLIWPQNMGERLNDDQIAAILAHELSHVRRRDNLVALVHMIVQAVFWFHPVVWWVGARLLDERERSCDQDVIGLGNEPEVYAESILKTCRFYVDAPVTAMSGMTGSDLGKRIEAIMRPEAGQALNGWGKLLLATAAIASVAGPLVLGVLRAPGLVAQEKTQLPVADSGPKFEVASVKANKSGELFARLVVLPGGRYDATNVPLRTIIRSAYQLQDFQLIGGPDWIGSERFDIAAKAERDIPPTPSVGTPDPMQMRLRALLAERFNLKVHLEHRELPVYALLVASKDGKPGAQLRPGAVDCAAIMDADRARGGRPATPAPTDGQIPCTLQTGPGRLNGSSMRLSQLASILSQSVQRVVVDRTGLTGYFDFDLSWTPDNIPQGPQQPGAHPLPPVDPNSPSIFAALQEQLGLKLETERARVEVLVIDRVELPTSN